MRWPAIRVVPAMPGKRRLAVDARAALEVGGVRALDDHEARADARDRRSARSACRCAVVALQRAGEEGDPAALVGDRRRARAPRRRSAAPPRRGASSPLRWSWRSFAISAEIGSCQSSVTTPSASASAPTSDQQRPPARAARARSASGAGGRRAGAVAEVIGNSLTAPYRRRADSVPPSEPGPA